MNRYAFLLAGGKGTRLKNLISEPKPFLKINEEPYIFILIKWCYLNKIKNINLIINKENKELLHNLLIKYDLESKYKDLKISILIEDTRMGTGGYLANNIDEFPESFFIINSDTIYTECISHHINYIEREKSYSFLFGLKNKSRIDAGNIEIDDRKFIKIFREKNGKSNIISSGIYFLKKIDIKKSLEGLKLSSYMSLEEDIVKSLVKKKLLKCIPNSFSTIHDFGTPERLQNTDIFLKSNKYKWLLIDRDNTINKDNGYTFKLNDLELIEKILPLLQGYQARGYFICIITNQSGVSRGYYSLKDMHRFNEELSKQLEENYNIHINFIKFCIHLPNDKCNCRKPNIQLLNELEKDFGLDKRKTLFVGDSESDELFAKKGNIAFLKFIDNYE